MIFVVGPGRCGTSTTARVLHTQLDVFMGEHFRDPDKDNPDGYWEDLEFKNLNDGLLGGGITFPEWTTRITNIISRRQQSEVQWGVKDPRLCYLLGFYLHFVENPVIIRCLRDDTKIVESIIRCYGWARNKAIEVVEDRERQLDNLLGSFNLPNVIHIDFNEPVDDKTIKLMLAEGGIPS